MVTEEQFDEILQATLEKLSEPEAYWHEENRLRALDSIGTARGGLKRAFEFVRCMEKSDGIVSFIHDLLRDLDDLALEISEL